MRPEKVSATPRVEQCAGEPEVGKWYLVPCVRGERGGGKLRDWPVLLPLHEDAEIINFPHMHYHLDLRFLSESLVAQHGPNLGNLAASPLQTTDKINQAGLPRPVWRRRRCARRMPPFPIVGYISVLLDQVDYLAPWIRDLEAAQPGEGLKRASGRSYCPHRGARLDDQPIDADGCVVCPMHGLRWHLESGALRPHDRKSCEAIRKYHWDNYRA